MNVRLEKASKADATLFTAMEEPEDTAEFILPCGFEAHARNLENPDLVHLRIIADERVVGYFVLSPDLDGDSVEFRRIVVADKGRGIGQCAIGLMEQYCRDRLGRSRIWLDVFEHNARGRHVYEKLGYSRTGETEYSGVRALVYKKSLE